MRAKQALDELFEGVKFDDKLFKAVIRNNIDFITSTTEHKELFGSRLIGCFHISYTQYQKNIFYEALFGLSYDTVMTAMDKIDTIPKHFKIARDDVNLITFYIAHRFLTSPSLDKKKQHEAAEEILHYFNYRTLVLLSSAYWMYPISEDKAVSLSERLSNKYIIKQVKNWNEYCKYRSSEYMKSRFVKMLLKFDKDDEIPNAITDLFNGTKDALKNIYREFLDMLENDDMLRSSRNVVTDIEGKEVLMDRTESPIMYINKVESTLIDKHAFIKRDMMEVTVSVIDSVSIGQLEECLGLVFDYYFVDRKSAESVRKFIQDFLINCFEYLQTNEMYFTGSGNALKIVNKITGNVLYSRGTNVTITEVKKLGDKLITDVYRKGKVSVGNRSQLNIRNAFCIYILLVALL